MKLNELILDIDFLELSMALMEGKKGVNTTVAIAMVIVGVLFFFIAFVFDTILDYRHFGD